MSLRDFGTAALGNLNPPNPSANYSVNALGVGIAADATTGDIVTASASGTGGFKLSPGPNPTIAPRSGGTIVLQNTGGAQIAMGLSASVISGGVGFSRTPVADVNYNTVTTDAWVVYASLSAARVVTLTTPATMTMLIVKDESGAASGVNTITVQGSGGKTIDGAANKVINVAYGGLRLYFSGTQWFTF